MRTAAAIVGYNRPYYFLPSLRSILRNAKICDCDLWVFLDGGPGSAQQVQVRMVDQELARAAYRPQHVEIVLLPAKFDCGRNLIDARRRLFDGERYDLAFIFEDDMVLGPHYLDVSLRLWDWARANYHDVGVVQAYNACLLPARQKVGRLDEVMAANSHWWGYLMSRETWASICSVLYRYEHDFLCGHAYRQRDIGLIRRWVHSLIAQLDEAPQRDAAPDVVGFPGAWNFRRYALTDRSCGQDAITAMALALARLTKLVTTVNRSLPIGRQGIHFTSAAFKRRRLDQIELDVFESDRFRAKFRPFVAGQQTLTPYMRADEVEALRSLIRDRSPARVLELGAGGSSIVLSREPGIQQWWTLEQNGTWIARVLSGMSADDAERITVLRCDEDAIIERLDLLLRDFQFDMFFVDGFDRPRVLERLHRHLSANGGFVVLHDYGRSAYENAIQRFSTRQELTRPCRDAQGLMLLEAERGSS